MIANRNSSKYIDQISLFSASNVIQVILESFNMQTCSSVQSFLSKKTILVWIIYLFFRLMYAAICNSFMLSTYYVNHMPESLIESFTLFQSVWYIRHYIFTFENAFLKIYLQFDFQAFKYGILDKYLYITNK